MVELLRLVSLLACFVVGCSRRIAGANTPTITDQSHEMTIVRPAVLAGSHNLPGYEAACAADGDEGTYWLVPGGQRMEMMSRDKWLVFDLGCERTVHSISLLGEVDSFGPARVLLDAAQSPRGPWWRVSHFRGLQSLDWHCVRLTAQPTGRFFRIYIRREGHATFRHKIHGVLFNCRAGSRRE